MTRTVVSITPLRADRDSRTFRAAMTFKRYGYNSIVVEEQSSKADVSIFPFSVLSLHGRLNDNAGLENKKHATFLRTGFLLRIKNSLKHLLPKIAWECGTFIWFVYKVFFINVIKGILIVPRADLYYLHEYRLFPMVYLSAKAHKAKIIYDAHDYYPGVYNPKDLTTFWKFIFLPFLVWLEGICIRRVDAMLTVNNGIAELYRSKYGVEVGVTRNCDDDRLHVPVDMNIRDLLGIDKDVFLLVTVGNNKPGQAVENALNAMAKLDCCYHLAFVGRGYDKFTDLIKKLDLCQRVHLLPSVNPNEVVPFIKSANAGLIIYFAHSLNDRHFLPNGFFHLLSAKLPILYPDLMWIRDIAEKYDIGDMIDSLDSDSIKDGIMNLAGQINERGNKGNSFGEALKENSWQAEEEKLMQLIGKILD